MSFAFRHSIARIACCALIGAGFCESALAQQLPAASTHENVVEVLLADCVASLIPTSGPFAISRAPDTMPADPIVFGKLRDSSRTFSLVEWEASSTGSAPLFRYQLETANVKLRRDGRKFIQRDVSVSVPYTLIESGGTVADAGVCTKSSTDTIPRSVAAEWSGRPSSLPMNVDDLPRDSIVKRFVRPVVAVAATSVSLYLLFSLRSERANDSQ